MNLQTNKQMDEIKFIQFDCDELEVVYIATANSLVFSRRVSRIYGDLARTIVANWF